VNPLAWAAVITRVVLVIGLNVVPIWGFEEEQWSPGTVLALYWLQTLLSIPLIAGLIILRWRMESSSRSSWVSSGGKPKAVSILTISGWDFQP
jgi:Family of unknown function (DUF6498)